MSKTIAGNLDCLEKILTFNVHHGLVAIFERALGCAFALEHVPMRALEEQHQSTDPLQKAFAALMMAYALGDPVAKARQTADRYGVQLTAVEDYAANLRP